MTPIRAKFKIILSAITCALMVVSLTSYLSHADSYRLDDTMLSPPLRSKQTAADDNPGLSASSTFHEDYLIRCIGDLVARMLVVAHKEGLNDPAGILAPQIRAHTGAVGAARDIDLSGVDIDHIETLRAGSGLVTAFSLPITTGGLTTHKVVYNLDGRGEKILSEDGIDVYAYLEDLPSSGILDGDKDEKIRALAQLKEMRQKAVKDMTADDKGRLIELAKAYNFRPDLLEREIGGVEYVTMAISVLSILMSAELAAFDHPEPPKFNRAAIDEISDGIFAHELANLFYDMTLLDGLKEDIIRDPVSVEDIRIKQKMIALNDDFKDRLFGDMNGWKTVFNKWEGLKNLPPRMMLALVDDAMEYIRSVMSARAEIVALVNAHGKRMEKYFTQNYLPFACRYDIACETNLRLLEYTRQNALGLNGDAPVDINESIRSTALPYQKYDKVGVRLDLSDGLPSISGNSARIAYIWTNLIGNAIDAILKMEKGGGEIAVSSRAIGNGDRRFIEVRVSDTGTGIPDELLHGEDNIFKKGVTTKGSGHGQGLHLVSQAIKEMKGSIDVESEVGRGTTFILRFPSPEAPADFVRRESALYANVLDPELRSCEEALAKLDRWVEQPNDEEPRKLILDLTEAINGLKTSYNTCSADFARRISRTQAINLVKERVLRGISSAIEHIMNNAASIIEAGVRSMRRAVRKGEADPSLIGELTKEIGKGLEEIKKTLDYLRNIPEVSLFGADRTSELFIPGLNEPGLYKGKGRFHIVVTSFNSDDPGAPFAGPQSAETSTGVAATESECVYALNLQDMVKYVQATQQSRPLIVALGTGWIKDYEKGEGQYKELNPLISSIRNYCQSRGIRFIDDNDNNLLARISAMRTSEGMANAKVVILAGKDTVTSDELSMLRDDRENIFVAGVDNHQLAADSYVRLVEMLTLAMKLSIGLSVDQSSTPIVIQKDGERNIYIFTPPAEPVNYVIIYKAQIKVLESA